MTNINTYKQHYKTLDLSTDCSWQELRISYKKQIQLHHPDRLTDGSNEKDQAQEYIKSLNLAYQDLSKYYKVHNCLPLPFIANDYEQTNDTYENNREPFTFDPSDTSIHQLSKPHKNRKKVIITLLFVILISGYILNELNSLSGSTDNSTKNRDVDNNQQLSAAAPTQASEFQSQQNIDSYEQSTGQAENISPETKTFTFGSSIGTVMDAQGIPDRSTENIWYYGKSTVTFKNGKVASWYRHKASPLNIGMSSL